MLIQGHHGLLCVSGVFIAEEVDGVGDKWSGITMAGVQALLDAFLNVSLRSACFIDENFFC